MDIYNESYLRQKQEWVKHRLKALDEIEIRLIEMRSIAVLVRDSNLDVLTWQELNDRFHVLENEVNELDEKSKNLLDGLSVNEEFYGHHSD
jgi:hypothetical protein